MRSILCWVVIAAGLGSEGCCGHCNTEEICFCEDGTRSGAGCVGPPSCQAACSSHGGVCGSTFTPSCNCVCGTLSDADGTSTIPYSACAVQPATCQQLCGPQGGVSDGGLYDVCSACSSAVCSDCYSVARFQNPSNTLPDGGVADGGVELRCFCGIDSCGIIPDGGS